MKQVFIENNTVQVEEDGMDIEDHVNPMEEYDTNNIVEDAVTNILIQEFLNAPMV